MAWNDDYESFPDHWFLAERQIYAHLVRNHPEIASDQSLQLLFDVAWFQEGIPPRDRDSIQATLDQYLYDEYRLYFDDLFDWTAYEKWYESLKGGKKS